jgi:hypothetical protein
MKTQSPDTSIEAERFLIERLRDAGPARRLAMACDASRALRQLTWNGLRHRHPGASEAELRRRFVALTYGEDAARRLFDEAAGE